MLDRGAHRHPAHLYGFVTLLISGIIFGHGEVTKKALYASTQPDARARLTSAEGPCICFLVFIKAGGDSAHHTEGAIDDLCRVSFDAELLC